MSDLISRSEVNDVIDELEVYTYGKPNTMKVEVSVLQLKRFINKLKNIQTAYSVDKIVDELKKRKQEYLEAFIIHGDNELYGIACGLGDAIDIVERSFNNGLHRYNNI